MLTGKDLGAAIRAAITKKGVTQKAVADAFGVKPPSIQDWINKGTISKDKLPMLWSYFGDVVGPEHWGLQDPTLWPGANEGAPAHSQLQPIDLDSNPDYPAVRRVKFKLSAGASGFGIEYLEGQDAPIVFRRDWFEANGYRPDRLFATRVANGSMEPGLYDGDIVVVNTDQNEARDGAVFAVNYEGELVIKRLIRDAGQWWLHSDNPNQNQYPRKQCHEGVFLLGQIVYKQSSHI